MVGNRLTPFQWQDGERTIRLGLGALADAPALPGDDYVCPARVALGGGQVIDTAETLAAVGRFRASA